MDALYSALYWTYTRPRVPYWRPIDMSYRLACLIVALIAAATTLAAQAPPTLPTNCTTRLGISLYLVCPAVESDAPVVLYAHGYVAPVPPVEIPWSQLYLPDGTFIPSLINQLGFAFATTSYPVEGLATVPGVLDLVDLLDFYRTGSALVRNPSRVYLAGVSEGALIATKALETYPNRFSAGIALCGPIGDFKRQINHFGDFRAVFDFYFPQLMPGTATWIPTPPPHDWPWYEAQIRNAASTQASRFLQPHKALSIPVDPSNPSQSAVDILWYSFYATNNANDVLGGNPFDNRWRWYTGSSNDFALNFGVRRYDAAKPALDAIQRDHQTTGRLSRPLVTMHTTGDPIVPYWHMNLYGLKVLTAGSLGSYLHLPVLRYGHCAFQKAEILFGFALMVGKSGGAMASVDGLLDTPEARAAYLELERIHQSLRK